MLEILSAEQGPGRPHSIAHLVKVKRILYNFACKSQWTLSNYPHHGRSWFAASNDNLRGHFRSKKQSSLLDAFHWNRGKPPKTLSLKRVKHRQNSQTQQVSTSIMPRKTWHDSMMTWWHCQLLIPDVVNPWTHGLKEKQHQNRWHILVQNMQNHQNHNKSKRLWNQMKSVYR